MNCKDAKNLLKLRDSIVVIKQKLESDTLGKYMEQDLFYLYQMGLFNINKLINEIDEKCLAWCEESSVGEWLLRINGITPDLALGLLAYFNVKGKECASQFIKYAGADNTSNPHNSVVAEIIEKIKINFKSHPNSLYRLLWERKYKELLQDVNLNMNTIQLRADRYLQKVFISHLFEEMYREEHNGMPPERHNYDNRMIIEPEVPYTR